MKFEVTLPDCWITEFNNMCVLHPEQILTDHEDRPTIIDVMKDIILTGIIESINYNEAIEYECNKLRYEDHDHFVKVKIIS